MPINEGKAGFKHTDAFLKIKGIPGESADSKHKGEIDILSFSCGIAQTGTMSYGGGGGAGKSSFTDFSVKMRVSKATPKLMQACANGTHFDEAILTCRKAGGKQEEFMVFKFFDLLIASHEMADSFDDTDVPRASVSLNFAKIEMEYKEQDSKGQLGGATSFKYDVKANKAY